ncbi:hypothetical protein GCM10009798_33540 [Nocardioides panacihumi]|uniref:Uncharacterized protein n=1 Tax=Nocardioides panacihumi TaxID=400774 RepID=A0ABN2RJD3_9ACTN
MTSPSRPAKTASYTTQEQLSLAQTCGGSANGKGESVREYLVMVVLDSGDGVQSGRRQLRPAGV